MAFLLERPSLTLVMRRHEGQSTRNSLVCFRNVKVRKMKAGCSGSRCGAQSGPGPASETDCCKAVMGPLMSSM